MGWIVKLLALWGIADSILLAARPRKWSGFWGDAVTIIGSNPKWAQAVASFQLAFCLYLLKRK
jgi:hypothetical protein